MGFFLIIIQQNGLVVSVSLLLLHVWSTWFGPF